MESRRVVFECLCSWTVPGQWVGVVGSSSQLGSWDVRQCVRLHTNATSFPVWTSPDILFCDCLNTAEAPVEFKFVVVRGPPEASDVVWEQLPANRRLPAVHTSLHYRSTFGEEAHEEIPLLSTPLPSRCHPQEATWMGRSRNSFSSSLKRLSSGVDLSPQSVTAIPASSKEESCTQLLMGPSSVSTVSSPLSASGTLTAIVEGNANAPSWGAKLELVKNIVRSVTADGTSLAKASPEQLVSAIDTLCYAGVYTEFVRQGAVPCKEDGHHFRPNRHANLSKDVSIHLEMLLQAVGARGDDLASALRLVIRSIPPSLPSFADAFRAAQPLTRIRNIAHRDDIPMELKNEIKHTIQNKLHRCAGPEDLETTRKLLERVQGQAKGGHSKYSAGFVSELQMFHRELCTFFNQSDLCERLLELRRGESPRTAEAIDRYLDAKTRSDTPGASATKLLLTLGLATDLRIVLALQLRESGLLQQDEMQHIQNKRMAELQLEDAAFVLLSRLVNIFDDANTDFRWTDAIEALCLGTRNIEASGIRREECQALQREFQNHLRRDLRDDEEVLLLKASVDRCRRLSQDITDMLLAVYVHRVDLLGLRLGVDSQYRSQYAEGRIRSNVIFQLAKVSNVLLRSLRQRLHQQPYDVLVPGHFVGRVAVSDTLEQATLPLIQQTDNAYIPLFLCAKSATGDEEVAGIDTNGLSAAGVLVGHDLPILSHLGVRARQQRLPFIACHDSNAFNYFSSRRGSWLQVHAAPESFTCKELSEEEAAVAVEEQRKARIWQRHADEDEGYPLNRSGSSVHRPLIHPMKYPLHSPHPPQLLKEDNIVLAACGSKAATCARLEAAAKAAEANNEVPVFRAPRCLCLPFGSMEWVIYAEGRINEFETILQQLEDAKPEDDHLEELCQRMQQLILTLPLPHGVDHAALNFFGNRARLCLRSSANMEDLPGMSAAGLYESVANVSVEESAALQSAVCTVWASLFSRRAVLSRKVAGVRQVRQTE